MLGADPPALEPHRQGRSIERIRRRHPINHHQAMHVELQLHQELVAEGLHQIARVRCAAHMADLDLRARRVGERQHARLLVKARQLVLDRTQRLDHLSGQKRLGPLLRLGKCQHVPLPPDKGENAGRRRAFPASLRPQRGPRPP